jgi:hypothetical protein
MFPYSIERMCESVGLAWMSPLDVVPVYLPELAQVVLVQLLLLQRPIHRLMHRLVHRLIYHPIHHLIVRLVVVL